jgi:hypothetical protein
MQRTLADEWAAFVAVSKRSDKPAVSLRRQDAIEHVDTLVRIVQSSDNHIQLVTGLGLWLRKWRA